MIKIVNKVNIYIQTFFSVFSNDVLIPDQIVNIF